MASPSQLSFLPDDYLERKAQRRTNAICAVLFVMVICGVGWTFRVSEQATRRLLDQDSAVEAQYVGEAKRIVQAKEMQEKERRMAHQAELSAALLERVPRSYVLAEITNSLPSGVSLLDLSLESKVREQAQPVAAGKTAYEMKKAAKQGADASAAAPAKPKLYDVTMKVTGVASTDVQVAAFLNRLSHNRLFKEANLVISDEFKFDKDTKLRKFQIELVLNPDADVESGPATLNNQTAAVEIKE